MRWLLVGMLLLTACAAPVLSAPTPTGPVRPAVRIPPMAEEYREQVLQEVRYYWGWRQSTALFAAQIHQESGWRAGVCSAFACGLTQFTPGTASSMAHWYPAELGQGRPLDPAWAIKAMVVYDKRLYLLYAWAAGDERLSVMLVAYNGGPGWVDRERAKCLLLARQQPGTCDLNRWYGQIERVCLRSEAACRESRHYPRVILYVLQPAYRTAGWN